jgi:hypothetical protein
MTACAEAHQLLRIVNIQLTLVVGLDEPINVDQNVARRRLSRPWMDGHG